MKQDFNADYWQQRYLSNQTGWDTQGITTPLKAYFDQLTNKDLDQLTNKDLRILIPGCGNAYEAEYLFNHGFTQVYIADVAPAPLENFARRVNNFPKDHLLLQNFFDLQGQYDMIVEQTFFCALNPDLRAAYARKCAELLVPGGRLVGLLFDTEFAKEGPPFGGSAAEYRLYFEPYFDFVHFERAYNSISPRQGSELFIILQKK